MSTTTKTVKDAAESVGDSLASDLETLKSDFNQLRSDVTGLLGHAADAGRAGASNVRDKAYDAMQDLKDRGAESLEAVGEQIGEYPIATALIAFGVGVLAAKLMSRR